MNQDLINSSYDNAFGIDLRKYHEYICKIGSNEPFLVEEINQSNRISFNDGVSSGFRLELHNDLLYLVGDRTCYLCSHVVNSAYGSELNWVACIVMPKKQKVLGETDIRKSGVIISLFSDLVPQIPDEKTFFNFIDQLRNTFSQCEWFKNIYSISLYVRLVKFWDYRQKINCLYELGLLYPLEFAIYTIYKGIKIENEQTLKYFITSLSESTGKILPFEELNTFFQKLSQDEIEEVLAIPKVTQNVNLDILNDDYFADILEIDGVKRYPAFVDDTFYVHQMRTRADSIFRTPNFRKEYNKTLKQNFRALENKARKDKGYEGVGTFFMEQLLYDKLRMAFPDLTLHREYSPSWLRPLRIDIFIEECDLAIEYHGAQHYLPIVFFGGTEGLELRKQLDSRKKEKCYENSIALIEISFEEDFEFAFQGLTTHIHSLL